MGWTRPQIAKYYHVSEKTIWRRMQELEEQWFEVHKDPYTGTITFCNQTEANDFLNERINTLEKTMVDILKNVKSTLDENDANIKTLTSVVSLQRTRINQLEAKIEKLENERA